MLKITPAITIRDIRVGSKTISYMLFPDHENENIYYAMADEPTFALDKDRNPQFNLTWYYDSKGNTGGICTMTVALPTPDLKNEDFRLKLEEAFKGKDIANLEIKAMPYKSGAVTVQAFSDKDAYQEEEDTTITTGKLSTTPSLMNDNNAVVTFNLSEKGVKLFWGVMGGPPFKNKVVSSEGGGSSVISVIYEVEFEGLLPEATAVITVNKKLVSELILEETVTKGSWGREYRKTSVKGKKRAKTINDNLKITIPYAEEGDNNVQDLLTGWATKQMEEMVASQLPDIKLDELTKDGLKKTEQIQEQKRTFKFTKAVLVPKYPQGLLPRINASEPIGSNKFFHLINLNDKPYFDVALTVVPPRTLMLHNLKIDKFVITSLEYHGSKLLDKDNKEVSVLEYSMSEKQLPSKALKGTFSNSNENKDLKYSYLVIYSDRTRSFKVENIEHVGNQNYLDLSSVDLGVLSVDIKGEDLPWAFISSVKIKIKSGDWEDEVTLDKKKKSITVVKPFGKEIKDTPTYTATFNLKAGAPIEVSSKTISNFSNGKGKVFLESPLGDTVVDVDFDLDSDVSKAVLRVEYTMTADSKDHVFSGMIKLDKSDPDKRSVSWKVPSQTKSNSIFKVTKLKVTNNEDESYSIHDLSGGLISPLEEGTVITVLIDGLENF